MSKQISVLFPPRKKFLYWLADIQFHIKCVEANGNKQSTSNLFSLQLNAGRGTSGVHSLRPLTDAFIILYTYLCRPGAERKEKP